MTPDEYCLDKTTSASSSFTQTFKLLPADKRQAMTALYAFCREVDDIVDDCLDLEVAEAKLGWWQQELLSLSAGTPSHPITKAISQSRQRFNLSIELFEEILAGMKMDLMDLRYQNYAELSLYCYRVASVVGLLTAEILGYKNRQTLKYAHELGIALQLVNIIRDVGEDARRGRIYLPLEELEKFGLYETDVLGLTLADSKKKAFQSLMQHQSDRAKVQIKKAISLLPPEDKKSQKIGLMMAAVYQALLIEIEQDGFRVLTHRVSLPPVRKPWIMGKVYFGFKVFD